jgi:pimeloyl-ACP methyl ester carboxylesterase
MFCQVHGAKLYFDVRGCSLVAAGPAMREKPTLLLLHGRPGFDHALFKPAFSAFADIAQVIYQLVIGRDRDPVMPIQFAEMIAAFLPAHVTRFERLEGRGHVSWRDEQARAFKLLREFILN